MRRQIAPLVGETGKEVVMDALLAQSSTETYFGHLSSGLIRAQGSQVVGSGFCECRSVVRSVAPPPLFPKPNRDNRIAGRGPIRPYRAETSKVTQTAIIAHKGNQNIVVCPRKPYSVESLDTAATNRNAGVAISNISITAKMVRLRVEVFGTLRPPPTARFICGRSVLDG